MTKESHTMELDIDEIAGILGRFGGLTREELDTALEEVAFRRGEDAPPRSSIETQLTDGEQAGAIVRTEVADATLLVPGPAAFPVEPAGAEDLPHILDITPREIDRRLIASSLIDDIKQEITTAPNQSRRKTLLDLSYDIEAWSGIDAASLREQLDTHDDSA